MHLEVFLIKLVNSQDKKNALSWCMYFILWNGSILVQ